MASSQQYAISVWDITEVDLPAQKVSVWDDGLTFWDVGVLH